MATLKITVKSKKNDGTYNVKILLTHNRQSAWISTKHYVTEREINKKTGEIKNCAQKDYAYRDLILMREDLSKISNIINQLTAAQLAARLKIVAEGVKSGSINLTKFWQKQVDELKAQGKSSYKNYQAALRRLEEFSKKDVYVTDVTTKYLEDFEKWIDQNVGGVRSTSLYMSSFRKIFNDIRAEYNDEELGLIKIPNNPFLKYKVPRQSVAASGDRALSSKIIRKIYNVELDKESEIFARNMFMLSFFLCGINSADIHTLSPKKIKANVLTYQRAKTKDRRHDNAEIKIFVEPEAEEILKQYREGSTYSFATRYTTSGNFNRQLNRNLKIIGAKIGEYDLTFYHARHSWATIAANECNISKDDIALALNHVSESHSITERYIRKDFSRIQKANQAVIKKIRARK